MTQASVALYAIPILLVLLTAVAGYAYAQIGSFALPIPKALALFTVVLPLVTGISTQSISTLIQQSSRAKHQLALPILAIIGFMLMYDTVIAVLAWTHILPPSALTCGLNDTWQKLFSVKDAVGIRAIQDAFDCCGLKTVKDRAFPFTVGKASTCAADFRRSGSCLVPWRKAEQWTAGLLLLVAVTVFILKVLAVVSLLTQSSWRSSKWARALLSNGREAAGDSEEEGDQRAVVRRLIEDSAGEAGYQDESPTARALGGLSSGGNENAGSAARVQPSQLIDVDNEWREEGGERHD